MLWLVCVIYGVPALIALGNYVLMRRPRPLPPGRKLPELAILIPARDEAENLQRLIPQLKAPNPNQKIYVYDDESSDATAEVAAACGATVIRGGPLPDGWTGKNYACDALARASAEDSDAEWLLFLDADVRALPDFVAALAGMAEQANPRTGVLTGFPSILPGRGIEPLFLGWVGWALLAGNNYGLKARTGIGHPAFTNGQVTVWRQRVYTELWPNRLLSSAVLEDVRIGRLLKDRNIGLEVANFSGLMQVKMYDTWRETLDGMSKNAFEITGSAWGSVLLALFLFVLAWGWLVVHPWWVAYAILGLSGLFPALTCRANVLAFLLMPIVLTLGSLTILRSVYWRKTNRVTWKGRTYPS